MQRLVLSMVVMTLVTIAPAAAQVRNQFGRQSRADAASRALVLAVQQGISSLPPTSGQSFVYVFDPSADVPIRSEQLGPVSFRAPQTVGQGRFSIRAAASYFSVAEELGPIDYLFEFDNGIQSRFARLGTRLAADVGLVNLSFNYGIAEIWEVTGNLPVVAIHAEAEQVFSSARESADGLGFAFTRGALRDALRDGTLTLRRRSFDSLGSSFNQGTHVGIGRISVGNKIVLLRRDPVQMAFSTEFFFPSPNESQFAGSNSAAVLPRLIASVRVAPSVRMHADVGYDWDFDVDELRRVVWNVGSSLALKRMVFDCGVGGSKFNSGIEWTPRRARGVSGQAGPRTEDTTVTALGNTVLGTTYVDFLAGAKVQVGANTVISGSVNVPLNSAGIRPTAVGTLAIEQYF